MAITKKRVIFNEGRHFFNFTRDKWINKATAALLDDDKEEVFREKIWNNIRRNPKKPRLAITEDFVNALFDGFEGGTNPDLSNREDIKIIFIWIEHNPALRQWFNAIIHDEIWEPQQTEIEYKQDFEPDTFELSEKTLKNLATQHKDLLKVFAPSVYSDRANALLADEGDLNLSEDELLESFSCEAALPNINMTLEILERLLNHKRHNSQLEMAIAANPNWVSLLTQSEWVNEKTHPYLVAARELQTAINLSQNKQGKGNSKLLLEQINSDRFDEIQAYFIAQHYWDKVTPYAQLGIVKSLLHFLSFGYFFSNEFKNAEKLLTDKSVVFEAKLLQQSSQKEDKNTKFENFLISHIRDNHSEQIDQKGNSLRSVVLGIVDYSTKKDLFDKTDVTQEEYSIFSETYIKSLAKSYSQSQEDNTELLADLIEKNKKQPEYFKDADNIQNDEILQIIRLGMRSGQDPNHLKLINTFKKACMNNQLMLLRIIRLARDSKEALLYLRGMCVYVSALVKDLPNLETIFEPDDIRTLFRLRNKDVIQSVFNEKRLTSTVILFATESNFEKAAYITLFELFARDNALHLLADPKSRGLYLHLHCAKVLFEDFDKTKQLLLQLWKNGFLVSSDSNQKSSDFSSAESNENSEDQKKLGNRNDIQTLFSAIEWNNLLLLIEYAQNIKDTHVYHLSQDLKGSLFALIQRKVENDLPENIFAFINPNWFTEIIDSLDTENKYRLISHMTSSDYERFFAGDSNLNNRTLLHEMLKNSEVFEQLLEFLSGQHGKGNHDNILLNLLTDLELRIPKLFAKKVSEILDEHSEQPQFKVILESYPDLNNMLNQDRDASYSI